MRQHLIRERNANLIKKAKEKFKERHEGKLFCEICEVDFSQRYGKLGKDFIEAHHIKERCTYPELMFDVDNGLTLCHECHKETDNYGWKARWNNEFGGYPRMIWVEDESG